MTVDIIIPCYYSAEIIQPCLEKIANQTAINDITVTLVNDCSPNTNCEYWDLISKYLSRIHIKYFKTEVNSGPGVARQLGLDNATSDWVMFIDDDDELYDETSIEKLLELANLEEAIVVTGQRITKTLKKEELVQNSWIHHHGSIYNRKLLKKINAYYDRRLSYFEEDGAFTRIIMYYGTQYKQVKLNEPVYIQKMAINHKSLTKTVNMEKRLLGLIGLNTLDVHYRDNSIKFKDKSVLESFIVISNLLYYATIKDIHFTHDEYNILLSFINEFIPFYSKLETQGYTQDEVDRTLNFYKERFNFDEYIFSINPLLEFKTQYLEWLRIIFTKLKME